MVFNSIAHTKYKPFRAVAGPVAKREKTQFVAKGPPPVAPRPNGSVYVHVYDTPGDRPGDFRTFYQRGRLQEVHHNKMPSYSSAQKVSYPYSQELIQENSGRVTPEVRLKQRSKKVGKGYKVLAEVNPKTMRSSTKGGRMFIKQKKRMEKYTSLSSDGKQAAEEEPEPVSIDQRSTPWNMAVNSSTAVKYMPSHIFKGPSARSIRSGNCNVLPPMSEPPPEWRAKVEANYKMPEEQESNPPPRRWNTADSYYRVQQQRSVSAEPASGNYIEGGDADYYMNGAAEEEYVGSENEPQQALYVNGIPTSAIYFNAKNHRNAPHRKQGLRIGRGTFVTAPNCQLDFNAKAVGWSRSFADQY